jgi:hypothetical protein
MQNGAPFFVAIILAIVFFGWPHRRTPGPARITAPKNPSGIRRPK